MSKRDLKNYLSELSSEQIAEQLLELYVKFPEVKTYYDFVFHPNEDKLLREAKIKISNEYFPVKSKRPKMRRSLAQKIIKHFKSLGVDAFIIGDVMLYNIEIAQVYSENNRVNSDTFYKSFYTSFNQSVSFMIERGVLEEFKTRLQKITDNAIQQKWSNHYEFSSILERFDY
jgi:putative NIF3 family GTP cyclohydrolase 1 type 2